MMSSRTATRAIARTARARAPLQAQLKPRSQFRFQSTKQEAAQTGGASGLVGGIAGGALVFAAGYTYYHFSGAKSIVNAASATKSQFKKLTSDLSSSAPEPNQAIAWLRSTATSYAVFIPGAKSVIDKSFDDLETVQKNHSGEVDQIVKETYEELNGLVKAGLSVENVGKGWEVLESAMRKLGGLAGDSFQEILDNHPEIKDKVGGNLDKLKGMGDSFGPEAKKEVENTYGQIKEVIAGGISASNIEKVKKLIEEKVAKLQKLGDEAWKKSLEQAKPYLDKNPQIKEIVEGNADALKQGNIKELFEKVKNGDTEDLKKFVQQAGEKAKKSGVGKSLEGYAKMIPGGSEILPKLQKLKEVAEKRGDEAEKILKGAYEDVRKVLEKRIAEAEKLGEKAGEDAKQSE